MYHEICLFWWNVKWNNMLFYSSNSLAKPNPRISFFFLENKIQQHVVLFTFLYGNNILIYWFVKLWATITFCFLQNKPLYATEVSICRSSGLRKAHNWRKLKYFRLIQFINLIFFISTMKLIFKNQISGTFKKKLNIIIQHILTISRGNIKYR